MDVGKRSRVSETRLVCLPLPTFLFNMVFRLKGDGVKTPLNFILKLIYFSLKRFKTFNAAALPFQGDTNAEVRQTAVRAQRQ